MRILIVAAHPDDEVLGCGASIAKWVNNGDEVNVLILAEGITSRDKTRNLDSRSKELSDLKKSALNASEILGVKTVHLLSYPDNRMDSVDLLDIVKDIENHIKKTKPQVVITHHPSDLNIDHQITFKATLTACRPLPENLVKRIMCFEILSSTEWQLPFSNNVFFPTWFEDITNTFSSKINALKCYEDELNKWPHPRSFEAVESLAKRRGSSVGVNMAEAFALVREIKA